MKTEITIPKPCHENWNKMTPVERGRHCMVCQKTVKDFTEMSNEAILKTLKDTSEEVCGRILVSQLTPVSLKQKLIFWIQGPVYRKLIFSTITFLGFSLFMKKQSHAQVRGNIMVKGKMPYKPIETGNIKLTIEVNYNYSGLPVKHALVEVYSKNELLHQGYTDINGIIQSEFKTHHHEELKVIVNDSTKNLKTEKIINIVKSEQKLVITMNEEVMILGKIAVNDNRIFNTKKICEKDSMDQKETAIKSFIADNLVSDNLNAEMSIEKKDVSLQKLFMIFPIPAFEYITIQSLQNLKYHIEIFDNNGKKIQSVYNIEKVHRLDVTQWAAGFYYIIYYVNNQAIEKGKIIVAK